MDLVGVKCLSLIGHILELEEYNIPMQTKYVGKSFYSSSANFLK